VIKLTEIVSEKLFCYSCASEELILKYKHSVWFEFKCPLCGQEIKALTLPDSYFWVIFKETEGILKNSISKAEDIILKIIEELEKKEGYASEEKIMELMMEKGYPVDSVREILFELRERGEIYSPKKNKFKMVRMWGD